MQQLWYIFLKAYVWLGLHVYFRKIIIQGHQNIPAGPVIFAANHQNAFLDALLIVCFSRHTTHFLTRADIFKKPFTRWLLSTLNMFPVYRIRDGWKNLTENKTTFEYCHSAFLRDEAVVIFPEGNHGARRNLRPLSKGFTRLASESLFRLPSLKIHIVPVGINYSDHQAFRSSVSVIFGSPILANPYMNDGGSFDAGALRDRLAVELQKLVTHVEDSDYESILHKLELTHPDYLDPVGTNNRIARIRQNETLATPPVETGDAVFSFPLYLASQLVNCIPLFVWNQIRAEIKDPVLIASIKFSVGIFLFPIFYLLVGAAIYWALGFLPALLWLLSAFLSVFFMKKPGTTLPPA